MSKVRPILFNTAMVRAILNGRKTVTRRVIKVPNYCPNCMMMHNDFEYDKPANNFYCTRCGEPLHDGEMPSPYQPGDILYVRETYYKGKDCVFYKASNPNLTGYRSIDGEDIKIKWHPSIHMPKEAARIWLKVTDVRVERLQDITEEQAMAEGAIDNRGFINSPENEYQDIHSAREHFKKIWDSTIKKSALDHYGWDANPWIWVIEFERCDRPKGWPG